MSGGDSFFARWSRQKRYAAPRSDAKEHPPSNTIETVKSGSPTTGDAPAAIPLPPIETTESASDIKAFLASGVPLEVTRAALRRAWRLDPAIRDFIGLSENAWDFDAPGGVPGFGPLDLKEVRRLVAQLLDKPQTGDPDSAAAPVGGGPATPAEPTIHHPEGNAAAQQENKQKKARKCCRRHHGGALPQ
jgi:hypothetical protein